MTIDLNCDMGELADAPEELLMPLVSSANVACGAHAGDRAMMERTIRLAIQHGVAVGAHPGYPDKENFGRVELAMTMEEIERSVYEQITALEGVAESLGCSLRHVKPHGALYNVAARDRSVAMAIAAGVGRWNKAATLLGLAGSIIIEVWRGAGFRVLAEAFADRVYEPDGTLRSRRLPGALITDPAQAAEQAWRIAHSGSAQTICIHGDTPQAVEIARAVRERLLREGVVVSRGVSNT
jgi:5-oxoprolinase (ATP-hydrolysing) subunit A